MTLEVATLGVASDFLLTAILGSRKTSDWRRCDADLTFDGDLDLRVSIKGHGSTYVLRRIYAAAVSPITPSADRVQVPWIVALRTCARDRPIA